MRMLLLSLRILRITRKLHLAPIQDSTDPLVHEPEHDDAPEDPAQWDGEDDPEGDGENEGELEENEEKVQEHAPHVGALGDC